MVHWIRLEGKGLGQVPLPLTKEEITTAGITEGTLEMFRICDELLELIKMKHIHAIEGFLAEWQVDSSSRCLIPAARSRFSVGITSALKLGMFDLILGLLERGVRVDCFGEEMGIKMALEHRMITPLEWFTDSGASDISKLFFYLQEDIAKSLFKDKALIQWIISRGPPLSEQKRPGLETAAQYAPLEIVRLLIDRGASFEQTDAIVLAALGHNEGIPDRLEVVKLLVQNGAPLDVCHMCFWDPKKWWSLIVIRKRMTGLHHAADGGKADLVELLLEYGADRSLTTFAGHTPQDLAMKRGHTKIVQLLEKNTQGQ